MIIRVFRVRVHDGKQQEFEQFLRVRALPLVQQQQGMISVQIGTPMSHTPNEFLVVTVWKDMAALKSFAGEQWQEPVIEPGEEIMLAETFLHHYSILDGTE